MKLNNLSKVALGVACSFVLTSGNPCWAFGWPGNSVQTQMATADYLQAKRQYAQALDAYLNIYNQNSGGDRHVAGLALSNAGECARKLNRIQEAKQYFSKSFMMLNSGTHVGDRDVNIMLVRYALCCLAENNYAQAESNLKQCLDNSLGIWTYNYSDLVSAASYTEMLAHVANNRNPGSGERWFSYAVQELNKLAMRSDGVGSMARKNLQRLGSINPNRISMQPPPQQINPPRRDPYFQPDNNRPWRARYGLNGTEQLFQNNWRTR